MSLVPFGVTGCLMSLIKTDCTLAGTCTGNPAKAVPFGYVPFLARIKNIKDKTGLIESRADSGDWQPLVDEMTSVQADVFLTGQMSYADRNAYEDRLVEQGIETYKQTLQEEAWALGCVDSDAAPPDGAELDSIHDRAQFAAGSVTGTYNLNLAKEIIAIGEATPTANMNTYNYRLFKTPDSWDDRYWQEKNLEVAQVETMTIVNAAKSDFYSRNRDKTNPSAVVRPYFAVCEVCQEMVGGNPYRTVTEIYEQFEIPPHPGCLLPGQKILVDSGLETIENVRAGTTVVIPEGKTEVVEVFRRPVQELIYRLEVGNRVLRLTGDHPVMTRNGWISVQELSVEDEVLVVSWCDELFRDI